MFLFSTIKIQNIGEITNFFRLSYPELDLILAPSCLEYSNALTHGGHTPNPIHPKIKSPVLRSCRTGLPPRKTAATYSPALRQYHRRGGA